MQNEGALENRAYPTASEIMSRLNPKPFDANKDVIDTWNREYSVPINCPTLSLAKEEYNKAAKKAAKAYRNDKANYKDYKKIEKQKAKDVWAARRNLKKAYDIDVGKELYSNGKRIRSNNAQLQIAASAALLTMYGARKIGNISKNERRAIDIGAAVAYGAYTIHLQSQNNKLKKYYGRTKK